MLPDCHLLANLEHWKGLGFEGQSRFCYHLWSFNPEHRSWVPFEYEKITWIKDLE